MLIPTKRLLRHIRRYDNDNQMIFRIARFVVTGQGGGNLTVVKPAFELKTLAILPVRFLPAPELNEAENGELLAYCQIGFKKTENFMLVNNAKNNKTKTPH